MMVQKIETMFNQSCQEKRELPNSKNSSKTQFPWIMCYENKKSINLIFIISYNFMSVYTFKRALLKNTSPRIDKKKL